MLLQGGGLVVFAFFVWVVFVAALVIAICLLATFFILGPFCYCFPSLFERKSQFRRLMISFVGFVLSYISFITLFYFYQPVRCLLECIPLYFIVIGFLALLLLVVNLGGLRRLRCCVKSVREAIPDGNVVTIIFGFVFGLLTLPLTILSIGFPLILASIVNRTTIIWIYALSIAIFLIILFAAIGMIFKVRWLSLKKSNTRKNYTRSIFLIISMILSFGLAGSQLATQRFINNNVAPWIYDEVLAEEVSKESGKPILYFMCPSWNSYCQFTILRLINRSDVKKVLKKLTPLFIAPTYDRYKNYRYKNSIVYSLFIPFFAVGYPCTSPDGQSGIVGADRAMIPFFDLSSFSVLLDSKARYVKEYCEKQKKKK